MATRTKAAGKAGDKNQGSKERLTLASAGVPAEKTPSRPKSQAIGKRNVAGLGGGDRAYRALIRRFPLRPLGTDDELDAAAAIIDELTDREDLSPADFDYLEVAPSAFVGLG